MSFHDPASPENNPASRYPGADSHQEPMAPDLPGVGALPESMWHNSEGLELENGR